MVVIGLVAIVVGITAVVERIKASMYSSSLC